MQAMMKLLLVSATLSLAMASASTSNPIRKVVTMLQDMSGKVEAEGAKELALYEKFMCYCKTNVGALEASIAAGKDSIGSGSSNLEALTEKKKTTEASLADHQSSRKDAKMAMAKATNLRDKQAADFATYKETAETNIAAMGKALAAIGKGMGSFLQTTAANTLRNYVMDKADVPDETRKEVLSFLSGSQAQGYAPASGEIVGILDQMKATMSSDLKDATAAENAAIKSYDSLMSAKKNEVDTLQAQIEKEMKAVGDLAIAIAETKDSLSEAEGSLFDDQKFLAELEKGCGTKTAEWEEVQKERKAELKALADTIDILNNDDALELFKKTLPGASASLMQIQVSASNMRARALQALRGAHRSSRNMYMGPRPQLDLIELALNGKQTGFDKVVKMIDSMVTNLKNEQADDDAKKSYCDSSFDETEDKKKVLEGSISDSELAIEDMTGAIETLTKDIAALQAGIAQLDKSVADATAQRKEEAAAYEELVSSDTAAKEILLFAKNRLNKYYNPKLYKAPPKQELDSESRIVASFSLAQISAHAAYDSEEKGAPPPPPETFGPYSKKTGESGGVIAMIDLLVGDLDKELQTAKVDEANAQEEYEALTADAGEKRKQDSESLTEKQSVKAQSEESLDAEKTKKGNLGVELMGLTKEIYALHGECDWLLKFYGARQEARTGEIDALTKAKAVLSGADYALLQTAHRSAGFLAAK